jgi:hypothetical protein
MKKVLIIAVALIAALPVAYANTYLFTSSPRVIGDTSATTSGLYPITVWGFNNASTSVSKVDGSISLNGNAAKLSYNSNGLGVAATNYEITLSSFVVVDFSDPGGPKPSGATTATFNIDNADSGWIIYGGTTEPVSGAVGAAGGISGLTLVTSGSLNNSALQVTLGSYSYLAIIAARTCYLNINSITTDTSTPTPEPATFALAGMALIGLGVALRKTRKR